MTDEKLEQILQQTLSPVDPDEMLNRRLKNRMEGIKMKNRHFSVKKTLVLAAACCLLVGTVCVASSGAAEYLSSTNLLSTYTDFSQLEKVEEKVGYEIRALESFQNAYTFEGMNIVDSKELDAEGNVIAKYQEISMEYENGAGSVIHMNMQRERMEQSERVPDKTIGISGIELSYCADHYKWVPADYELTAEDERNLERADYHISYGADEISEDIVTYASWKQDGIEYLLMSYEGIPMEVFVQMAEELINLPQ